MGGDFTDLEDEGGERGLCSCRGGIDYECSCDVAEAYGLNVCWCIRDDCRCLSELAFHAD